MGPERPVELPAASPSPFFSHLLSERKLGSHFTHILTLPGIWFEGFSNDTLNQPVTV